MNKIMKLIKWDLITNRHAYTLQLLAAYGLCLISMLLPVIQGKTDYATYGNYTDDPGDYIAEFYLLTYGACLTQISAPYTGKQSRISMLMLPASMQQKLISRLIVVAVILPLSLFLAVIAADLTHLALGSIFISVNDGGSLYSYMPSFIDQFRWHITPIGIGSYDIMTIIRFLTGLITDYGLTLFALACGLLWTRYALLKTGICCILIQIIYYSNLGHTGELRMNEIIAFVLCYSFIIFMLCLGYRTFINRELSEKKFLKIK